MEGGHLESREVKKEGAEEGSREEATVCTVYSGATPSPPPDTIARIVS